MPTKSQEQALGPGFTQLSKFADILAQDGVRLGLIGPREAERIWDRHILNCAALTELIDDGQSIIDIGSGAGLPGIPMAIARPDAQFVLIEPMERRSSWMLAVVEDLGLKNVRVLRSRAEDVSEQDFDIVTARAVAALDKLLKMCVPLLKPGGALIALKGSKAAEEITNSKKLEKKLGISSFEILVCGEKFLAEPTSVVKTTLDS